MTANLSFQVCGDTTWFGGGWGFGGVAGGVAGVGQGGKRRRNSGKTERDERRSLQRRGLRGWDLDVTHQLGRRRGGPGSGQVAMHRWVDYLERVWSLHQEQMTRWWRVRPGPPQDWRGMRAWQLRSLTTFGVDSPKCPNFFTLIWRITRNIFWNFFWGVWLYL